MDRVTLLRAAASIAGALVLLAGAPAARQARSQGGMLQDAIALMEEKGDYRGAVRVLEAVSAGPDRALAARGLLYLGMAHERLGTSDALVIYRKIVSSYTDQPVVVAEALKHLARLGGAPVTRRAGRTITRLWGPELTPFGPPTRDGRFIPGVDELGALALRDLRTLEIRRLCAAGRTSPTSALFSPDGGAVASVLPLASTPRMTEYEVQVCPMSGERSRTLYRQQAVTGQLAGWTPDGRALLVYFAAANGTSEIVRVDAAAESARTIARLNEHVFQTIDLSPDGRFAVFDAAAAGEHDIHVVDLTTGRERPLVQEASNDVFPLWTHDGRVLFASDRTGAIGLWIAEIENGRVRGEPQLVSREIGAMMPPGLLSAAGLLYYRREEGLVDVRRSTLDLERGSASAPAPIAHRVQGVNLYPSWASDGRRVVYVSRRGLLPHSAGGTAIVIADTQTGDERVLTSQVPIPTMPRWSPDGRWIVVRTVSDDGRGLNLVEVDTGAIRSIARAKDDEPLIYAAEWTPDGRALIYARGFRRIVRREIDGGRESTIYEVPAGSTLIRPALSHDGARVAVTQGNGQGETQLVVVPVDGGAAQAIFSTKIPERFEAAGWGPGDADVFIAASRGPDPHAPVSLLRVPVAGGPARPTGLVVPTMRDVRVSPDGRRLVFTVGWPTRATFALENFLPPPRVAAAPKRPAGR